MIKNRKNEFKNRIIDELIKINDVRKALNYTGCHDNQIDAKAK